MKSQTSLMKICSLYSNMKSCCPHVFRTKFRKSINWRLGFQQDIKLNRTAKATLPKWFKTKKLNVLECPSQSPKSKWESVARLKNCCSPSYQSLSNSTFYVCHIYGDCLLNSLQKKSKCIVFFIHSHEKSYTTNSISKHQLKHNCQ